MSFSHLLARKTPHKLKPPLRVALRVSRRIYRKAILLSPTKHVKVARFKKMKPLKLNVGSGKIKLPGWVNIDIEPGADVAMDVRKGLPFDNSSVDFIYCEHFLEHLTFEEDAKVLKEFHRCLREGGIVRIAMPDLDYIIKKYSTDWKNQDWLSWPEYEFIKTKGQMINVEFRYWGHKYLYNEEDLKNQLTKAGFRRIIRCDWNKSVHAELDNLETRKDSKLIMEAEKE